MEYKYKEDQMMQELQEYIDSTYSQHYSQNKYQATEFIIDAGHGLGFCIGNILKYSQRYGKKDGYNKKDLMKVLHYTIIALSLDEEVDEGVINNGIVEGTPIADIVSEGSSS